MLRLGGLLPGGDPCPSPWGSNPLVPLGLAPAWRLVPRGSDPRSPPCSSWVRSNPKPPTPLLYYLSEGEEFCLAGRLGQIDVAEAN